MVEGTSDCLRTVVRATELRRKEIGDQFVVKGSAELNGLSNITC